MENIETDPEIKILEYCMGLPGHAPRKFKTAHIEQVLVDLLEGEVYFHDANFVPWPHVISTQEPWTLLPSIVPVDWARTTRWMQAKSIRDRHMFTGCDTPKGRVNTDLNSQARITQFATDAAVSKLTGSTDWSVDWTMHDNTHVSHSADEMIAMGRAVNAYLSTCHLAAQRIRDQINAANLGEEIMSIEVDQGYPETLPD